MPTWAPESDTTWVYTDAELARERSCGDRNCACDHLRCFAGFLDDEEPDPVRGAPDHTRVVRCPACYDAVLMRGELAPSRRRR